MNSIKKYKHFIEFIRLVKVHLVVQFSLNINTANREIKRNVFQHGTNSSNKILINIFYQHFSYAPLKNVLDYSCFQTHIAQ